MDKEDRYFLALGRYTEAKEKHAEKLAKRDTLIHIYNNFLNQYCKSNIILDLEENEKLFYEIKATEIERVHYLIELNRNAKIINKPQIGTPQ